MIYARPMPSLGMNKAFWHVETLFVQGNQVRTDQNKPSCLVITEHRMYRGGNKEKFITSIAL